MARIRHLGNAPITEAIVDFRVALPSGFRHDHLREARERLGRDYPKAVERKGVAARFALAGAQPPEAQTRAPGFQSLWLKTQDEKTVAQFRVDGFTFNRLRPFTRWGQILPEAMRLWRTYVELTNLESVTRVALRYINHMSLPSPEAKPSDYIITSPTLPPSVPQMLSSFTTRVVLKHPERRMMANVIQTLDIGVETQAPTFLFDIDVYRTGDFQSSETVMKEILADLRAYKNEIFFGSLEERFVEAFE